MIIRIYNYQNYQNYYNYQNIYHNYYNYQNCWNVREHNINTISIYFFSDTSMQFVQSKYQTDISIRLQIVTSKRCLFCREKNIEYQICQIDGYGCYTNIYCRSISHNHLLVLSRDISFLVHISIDARYNSISSTKISSTKNTDHIFQKGKERHKNIQEILTDLCANRNK